MNRIEDGAGLRRWRPHASRYLEKTRVAMKGEEGRIRIKKDHIELMLVPCLLERGEGLVFLTEPRIHLGNLITLSRAPEFLQAPLPETFDAFRLICFFRSFGKTERRRAGSSA